ncbi:hypothetical protein DI53_3821 [Sphingobacterium deserti]|uniref:Uncharacterized protein n=1 Tax=Sphingobacterium deserti TaxID=1229276 RepID=A0A0B8T195_9SPHI|nr:hypothetical protein DI53_3821 [Sphingobacterium deserti]
MADRTSIAIRSSYSRNNQILHTLFCESKDIKFSSTFSVHKRQYDFKANNAFRKLATMRLDAFLQEPMMSNNLITYI